MVRDDQPFDVVVYDRSTTFHRYKMAPQPCGYCHMPGSAMYWLGTQWVCQPCYADRMGRPLGAVRREHDEERELEARIYEEKLGGPQLLGPEEMPPFDPDTDVAF